MKLKGKSRFIEKRLSNDISLQEKTAVHSIDKDSVKGSRYKSVTSPTHTQPHFVDTQSSMEKTMDAEFKSTKGFKRYDV